MESKKIGFIGTGVMGASIVVHLLNAGHDVTIYTRTKSKAEDLITAGAKWAETPAQASKEQDIVFTMVGYPKDVEEVYTGENGIFSAAKQGAIIVDMTTSEPTLAKKLYQEASERGLHSLDAPVSWRYRCQKWNVIAYGWRRQRYIRKNAADFRTVWTKYYLPRCCRQRAAYENVQSDCDCFRHDWCL